MAFEDDLTAATQALNGAAEAYHGKVAEIDAALAASQAGYNNLAASLVGVVKAQMTFAGTVDPANPAPTNVDGGTFASIPDLVAAAPRGAYIQATLLADAIYELDQVADLGNRTLYCLKSGAGVNPKIKPLARVVGAENWTNFFTVQGGAILCDGVDINLSVPKADDALPWNVQRKCLVMENAAGVLRAGFSNCTITGTDNARVVNGGVSCTVLLGLYSVTLSGAVLGIGNMSVGIVNKSAVTLAGGAAITSGGTLGTNLLEN